MSFTLTGPRTALRSPQPDLLGRPVAFRTKVLVVVRLYSGLERSVVSGRWEPTGVPTITRLIEVLAANDELALVLTCKSEDGPCAWPDDREVLLAGLGVSATVLAGPRRLPRMFRRWRWQLSEVRQVLRLLRLVRRHRPNLVYVDRGNMWTAGILARLFPTPVVYRVMGINPGLQGDLDRLSLRHTCRRWILRSPFALVLCTEDGSGGERWLSAMLGRDVPRLSAINGIDEPDEQGHAVESAVDKALAEIAPGKLVVLCAGRLDAIKGCGEFLEAFLRVRATAPGRLHAVFMGSGDREAALRARVAEAGADADVTWLGSVLHRDVHAVYRRADIYVSLNRMGSLTNTTLEALRAGCCSIILAADAKTGRDVLTDRLLPQDVVMRVPSADDTEALARAILHLKDHPDERRARGRAAARLAKTVARSWQDRVEWERELLVRLAMGLPLGAVRPQ